MELGLEQAEFERLAADYRATCGVGLAACRPDGQVVWGERWEREEPVAACAVRELAIREALRWGGPTF
ncbi:MAG: hypothetical protein HUU35_17260, partial [Armatimonadetes bacterium]|nr:hypothetical protein [Armatimonadota bacterium]